MTRLIYDWIKNINMTIKDNEDDVKKLVEYDVLLDATNSGGWLSKNMLHPKVWIASPGVLIYLDDEAYEMYKDRIIHDYYR